MSSEGKERARDMLLGGETDLKAIAEATALSEASVRGLKGSLVRSGQLESSRKKKAQPDDEDEGLSDPLPGEKEILNQILKDAGVKKKAAVLKLVDNFGYDVESIFRALSSVGAGRSIKRTVIDLWSTSQNEEIPSFIKDEIETFASRDRERGGRGDRLMSREEWEEKNQIRTLSQEVRSLKNMIQGGGGLTSGFTGGQPGRYREIRVPIDRQGNPCPPDKAVSVRYERRPISEGGDVQMLRQEISDLKEKMFSDQIQGLSNQIQELRERGGGDVNSIIRALEAWSSSEGGPVVRAASPLADAFGRKVLENYNALSPMSPEMRYPEKDTPSTLVERLRDQGFVATLHRGGGE